MARYQVILAYDGTDFLGFQRQGKARTVQLVFEAALNRLSWQGRTIFAAGRTDTGVHASGQVVSFDLDWKHSTEELGKALNANLPDDVAVKKVAVAADDFHPRYDAIWRSYQYHVYCQPEKDPLLDRFAWRVWPEVDLDQANEAARLVRGTHDYAAFGTPPRPGGSTIRVVYRAEWKPQTGGLLFEIRANAFLYHMVRRLTFLLVQAGQHRLDLQDLEKGVRLTKPQTPGLAPPNGLVLNEVGYGVRQEYEETIQAIGESKITWAAIGDDDRGQDIRP
jgi:tRNA pseudouridine38-40 synthase